MIIIQDLISKAKILFRDSGFDWAVCGGGAIDLFVGKRTRMHSDLDLVVFWEEREIIINFMLELGWRVLEACGGGKVHELLKGSIPTFERRNLFCFTTEETRCRLEPAGENSYYFSLENQDQIDMKYVEFLFNERDDDTFYYSGDRNIKRSLNKSFIKQDNVSFLTPELVLLYKSTYLGNKDAIKHIHDFREALPLLNEEQKLWLRESLKKLHKGNHQWLQKL